MASADEAYDSCTANEVADAAFLAAFRVLASTAEAMDFLSSAEAFAAEVWVLGSMAEAIEAYNAAKAAEAAFYSEFLRLTSAAKAMEFCGSAEAAEAAFAAECRVLASAAEATEACSAGTAKAAFMMHSGGFPLSKPVVADTQVKVLAPPALAPIATPRSKLDLSIQDTDSPASWRI